MSASSPQRALAKARPELLALALALGASGCAAKAGGGGLRLGAWNRDTRSLLAADADLKATSQLTFAQPKDHFAANGAAASAGATFDQRYFVNSEYASDPHAPVFLYICGESECTANAMNVFLLSHATKFRGHMLALEHRYYGASFPVADLTPASMRLLSTGQALEDVATFVRAMRTHGFDGPWVALGGSYPGSLAAYFRTLHPELVVGALASSAPVRAKEDFDEYDDHVAGALGKDCADATRRTVKRFDDQVAANDKTALAATYAGLGLPDASQPVDAALTLSSLPSYAVQYDLDVDGYCNAVQSSDPMPRLGAYRTKILEAFPGDDSDASSTSLPKPATIGGRSWYWQTCKEYGYWQTALADRARSVFSRSITLDVYREACKSLFDSATPADVAGTNKKYFEKVATATRILFTNGSNDPWSRLSLTSDTDAQTARDVYTYVIDGASHAEDLLYPQGSDSKSLTGAREKFDGLVAKWIKGENGGGSTGAGSGTGTDAGSGTLAGTLSQDLFLAVGDAAAADEVTLWASTPKALTGLELCAGDLTACTGQTAASVSFDLRPSAATGDLATRHVFQAAKGFAPKSDAPVTLIGRDQDGNVVARRQVSLKAK